MFWPRSMSRLDVVVRSKQVTQVTKTLAQSGIVHLQPGPPELRQDTTTGQALAERFDALAHRLDDLARDLELGPDPVTSPLDVDIDPQRDIDDLEKFVDEVAAGVASAQRELAEIRDARRKLLIQLEMLSLLRPLTVPLETLRQMKHVSLHVGVLRDVAIRRVEATLGELPHTMTRLPGPATGWDLVLVGAAMSAHAQVDRVLDSANFTPVEVDEGLTGLASEAETDIWQRLHDLDSERKTRARALRDAGSVDPEQVVVARRKVRAAQVLLRPQASFGRTPHLAYVTGWVPKDEAPNLASAISRTVGPDTYMAVRDPAPDDPSVPVELRNPGPFKPFEAVVTTYGLPAPREIDPTVVVGITYLLMFGAMFGDVGQGVLLALAGFWAARKWPSLGDIGRIIGMCGISAVVFGLVYGSVFGVEMELTPFTFPLVEHYTTVKAGNLAVFGGIAVAFGVVMLSVGILFNIINSLREGDRTGALLEPYGLVGLAFYWSALAWSVCAVVGSSGLHTTALAVVMFASLAVLFLREPIHRAMERSDTLFESGVGFFVIESLIDLMDTVIRFLSNTVSFIRVAAFGLTHAAMFMAVHAIGTMISGAPHGLGYVLAFVVGNIFVMVMEALIVSIQCLRLQYYEIFGKFFRGGGVPFSPLRAG